MSTRPYAVARANSSVTDAPPASVASGPRVLTPPASPTVDSWHWETYSPWTMPADADWHWMRWHRYGARAYDTAGITGVAHIEDPFGVQGVTVTTVGVYAVSASLSWLSGAYDPATDRSLQGNFVRVRGGVEQSFGWLFAYAITGTRYGTGALSANIVCEVGDTIEFRLYNDDSLAYEVYGTFVGHWIGPDNAVHHDPPPSPISAVSGESGLGSTEQIPGVAGTYDLAVYVDPGLVDFGTFSTNGFTVTTAGTYRARLWGIGAPPGGDFWYQVTTPTGVFTAVTSPADPGVYAYYPYGQYVDTGLMTLGVGDRITVLLIVANNSGPWSGTGSSLEVAHYLPYTP